MVRVGHCSESDFVVNYFFSDQNWSVFVVVVFYVMANSIFGPDCEVMDRIASKVVGNDARSVGNMLKLIK